MAKRILLVGAGSGGHAYPLVSVAQALRKKAQERNIPLELLVMGQAGFLEPAASQHQIPYKTILAPKFRRYFSLWTLWDILKAPFALIQSLWHVFWFFPDAVFSKGGFDSVLPVMAAWLYRIPVYIHESDTAPGLANRISSSFARLIFTGFPETAAAFPGKTTMYVGNPVRLDMLNGDKIAALEYFKFQPGIRTLLIFGGSQGAKQINDIILTSLVTLTNSYQILHQCGKNNYGAVKAQVDQLIREGRASYGPGLEDRYRLFSFFSEKDMALAYALADVIISRAGAGSLAEIAAVGKPAVVIPIAESANNHQLLNATAFSKFGAAVVEGANMTPHILLNQVQALLEPERYTAVSQSIRAFAKLDAADRIAETILGKL